MKIIITIIVVSFCSITYSQSTSSLEKYLQTGNKDRIIEYFSNHVKGKSINSTPIEYEQYKSTNNSNNGNSGSYNLQSAKSYSPLIYVIHNVQSDEEAINTIEILLQLGALVYYPHKNYFTSFVEWRNNYEDSHRNITNYYMTAYKEAYKLKRTAIVEFFNKNTDIEKSFKNDDNFITNKTICQIEYKDDSLKQQLLSKQTSLVFGSFISQQKPKGEYEKEAAYQERMKSTERVFKEIFPIEDFEREYISEIFKPVSFKYDSENEVGKIILENHSPILFKFPIEEANEAEINLNNLKIDSLKIELYNNQSYTINNASFTLTPPVSTLTNLKLNHKSNFSIQSIEVSQDYTILKCVYSYPSSNKNPFKVWIDIDTYIKQKWYDKKYKLIKAEGIDHHAPTVGNLKPGGSKEFTLYFEPLKQGAEEIEFKAGPWSRYGIKLNTSKSIQNIYVFDKDENLDYNSNYASQKANMILQDAKEYEIIPEIAFVGNTNNSELFIAKNESYLIEYLKKYTEYADSKRDAKIRNKNEFETLQEYEDAISIKNIKTSFKSDFLLSIFKEHNTSFIYMGYDSQEYNAEDEVFKITYNDFGSIYIAVPVEKAENFGTKLKNRDLKLSRAPKFEFISDSMIVLVELCFNGFESYYNSSEKITFNNNNLALLSEAIRTPVDVQPRLKDLEEWKLQEEHRKFLKKEQEKKLEEEKLRRIEEDRIRKQKEDSIKEQEKLIHNAKLLVQNKIDVVKKLNHFNLNQDYFDYLEKQPLLINSFSFEAFELSKTETIREESYSYLIIKSIEKNIKKINKLKNNSYNPKVSYGPGKVSFEFCIDNNQIKSILVVTGDLKTSEKIKESLLLNINEFNLFASQRKQKNGIYGVTIMSKFKKMDFGYNRCPVKWGTLMKNVSESDMIGQANAAKANGFTYHSGLKYGKLMIGEFPKKCKSPANESWPLYLKE